MKSLDELNKVREQARKDLGHRQEIDKTNIVHVIVGMGTCGITAGARSVLQTFVSEVYDLDLDNVVVEQSGCMNQCEHEPFVEIREPNGTKTTYGKLDAAKTKEIVHQHLKEGKIVTEYVVNTN